MFLEGADTTKMLHSGQSFPPCVCICNILIQSQSMYRSLQTKNLNYINYYIVILMILSRVKTKRNRKIATLEQVSPGIKAKPHNFTEEEFLPDVKEQNRELVCWYSYLWSGIPYFDSGVEILWTFKMQNTKNWCFKEFYWGLIFMWSESQYRAHACTRKESVYVECTAA